MDHESLRQQKIGVFDSGVGGLTVVRALEEILPGEDILYFGDSAHCPYGNRSREELLTLANGLLDFMEERQVKAIAVACNTMSTLYDSFAPCRTTRIFSIVEAGVRSVLRQKIRRVGLTATEFTVNSGWYGTLLHRSEPGIELVGVPNRDLARLIDEDRQAEIPDNVERTMDLLQREGPVKDVILGCTHYPIARVYFEEMAPDTNFIDPAREQALMLREWLERQDLLRFSESHSLSIYTSGNPAVYESMCRRLGLTRPDCILKQELKLSGR